MRFESSGLTAERNAGLSVITFTGLFFSLSSVYEQMRLLQHLHSFKGRYHYTRLDCQITTLNPTQSAEQIVSDIEEKRLWIKGYRGWQPQGVRDFEGNAAGGLSACFGATDSDRRATSYNKAAEQHWDTPARRDETRLRGSWAEQHTAVIATAISGARDENAAIEAYQRSCSAVIAQHMQYLDIEGTPIPRPKDWARGKKAPKWWNETLETEIEPIRLNRQPLKDFEKRFGHMRMQWTPTWAEGCALAVSEGRAETIDQASFDLAQRMLAGARPEHFDRALDHLPPADRKDLVAEGMKAADEAAMHTELT